MKKPSRWIHLWPKLAMCLVTLVMLDLVGARLLRGGTRKAPPVVKQHGVPYDYGLKPDQDVVSAVWGHRRFRLRTDSLGFRDHTVRDIPLATDAKRILFIGDSFTMGIGCDYADTFVGRVAEGLAGDGVEVLNAAVDGYSVKHYEQKTRYLVEDLKLEFDELVCCIDLSDVAEDLARAPAASPVTSTGEKQGPAPRRRLPNLPHTRSAKLWLREHSLVVEALYRMKLQLAPDMPIDQRAVLWTSDEKLYEDFGARGIALQMEHMDQLRDTLDQHGIGLTVVVYPWMDQILRGDLDSRQVSIWQEWTKERNCTFINVFPYFIPQDDPMAAVHRYFIRGDNHFNEAGHAIVAQAILDHFASREKSEQSTVTSDQ